MKTKITLHFYAKKTKANVAGLLPIYIRLTVDGERLEFSSKKFIEKSKWSDELSKMKGSSEEARSINNYLDSVKSQVIDIQMTLTHKREALNIENFRKRLFNETDSQRMLLPIYRDHNNRIEGLLGNGYAPGTLERFKISLKHLEEFLLWKLNVKDIAIDKIDFALITDFEFYFRINGLLYHALDKKGKRISVPIKASMFYDKPTLKNLKKKFAGNEIKRQPNKSRIKIAIDTVS